MKEKVILKRIVTAAVFVFMMFLAIVMTGNRTAEAATYTTTCIEGCLKNTEYSQRTKVGNYYFWIKYEGAQDGALYYATSKKGKAVRIAGSAGGIDSTITVSGNDVWYMKVADGDNLVYKYNIKSKKNTKIVNLPNFTTFSGIYGKNLYCYNSVKYIEYIYNTATKKYTAILKAKNSLWLQAYGRYQIAGGASYGDTGALYRVDLATGKVKTITKYCCNGENTYGYKVINGNLFYRAFSKAGQNYKNADSTIYRYTISSGKKAALVDIPKEGKCDDVVFTSEKILYFHFLGKGLKGYFSLNYKTENVEVISKKTFFK